MYRKQSMENQPLSTTIRAVIFDMDGLMLDSERIAQEAWQQAGREWGYDIPAEVYLHAVGRTAADTATIMRSAYGDDFPFDEMYARKQALLYQFIERGQISVKPGLFELLDLIEAQQKVKAVATSTDRKVALLKLTTSNLIDRFPVIVCGDEVERGKPAPDIYLQAAAKIDVMPGHCLVLEDSESGTKAAHAAGMIPVIVPDLKQPAAEIASLAHAVVDSLVDVTSMLSY